MEQSLETPQESSLDQFRAQGAGVLRGVLDPGSMGSAAQAVDRILASPTPTGIEYTPANKPGRYYGDFFLWRVDPVIEGLLCDSPLPKLAAEIMGVEEVYVFYDQLLVKEPGTEEPTPLHQDLPYWPIRGEGILSIWIPFDPVDEESGAVRYLAGSHNWGKFYAPASFSEDSGFNQVYADAGLEPMPDPSRLIHDSEEVFWDTEPGDVVIHNALVLHHSYGNQNPARRRRALAVRYVGPDVVFDARPGTFFQNPKLAAHLPSIDLKDGDPLRGELFPRVWPPRRGGEAG